MGPCRATVPAGVEMESIYWKSGRNIWARTRYQRRRLEIKAQVEKWEEKAIEVESFEGYGDVCIWSDIPAGQKGVYFEVLIHRMEGVIAVGVHSPTYK